MDATIPFNVDDLWQAGQPLPGRAVLQQISGRLGMAWGLDDFAGRVRIAYNPRMRTTLGRALLDECRVELNTRLLREHPEQLLGVLAHELAHIAARLLYGRVQPHGIHFRRLMQRVGQDPSRTHSLATKHIKRRRSRYLYLHRCSDCGYSFVARRVRRDCYCSACGPETVWNILRAADNAAGRRKFKQLLVAL
jgi:predicted SprT family Zn-dependent metalloprotease